MTTTYRDHPKPMAQSTSGMGCSISPFEPIPSSSRPSSSPVSPPHPPLSSSSSTASSSYSSNGSTLIHHHQFHSLLQQSSPPSPVSSYGTYLNDNGRSMTPVHSFNGQSPPSFPDTSIPLFSSFLRDHRNSPSRSSMHTCSVCSESTLFIDKCRDCGDEALCESCLVAHQRVCLCKEHISSHHRSEQGGKFTDIQPPVEVTSIESLFSRPIADIEAKLHHLVTSSASSVKGSRSSAPVGHSTLNHRGFPTSTEGLPAFHGKHGSMFSESRNVAIAALEEAIADTRATSERVTARAALATAQIRTFARCLSEAVIKHQNDLIASVEKVKTLKEGSLSERANQLQQALNRLIALPPPSSPGSPLSTPDAHVILNFILNPNSSHIGPQSRASNAIPPQQRTFVSVEEILKPCEDDYIAFQSPVDSSVILHALTTAGRVISSAYSMFTVASGKGLQHALVGHSAAFEVRMRDHLGQLSDIPSDAFTIKVQNPDGSWINGSVEKFKQDVSGTINASWMPTQEGTHTVNVLLRGKHIRGSPFVVQAFRIRDYTNVRNPLMVLGGEGEEEGRLCRPWGVAVDKRGNIVVADRSNNRIQIFSSDGRFLQAFGKQGSGRGEFERPAGVACDCLGRIVVADKDNHRIQVFSATDASFLLMFGERGSRVGQFHYPWDVDCAPDSGAIVVSDTRNHRVQLFTPAGVFIQKFGFEGSSAPGMWKHFDSPRGVCFFRHRSPNSLNSAPLPFTQMDGRKIKISEKSAVLHDNFTLKGKRCLTSEAQPAVGSLPTMASDSNGCSGNGDSSPGNAIWTTHHVVVTDFNNHILVVIDPDFVNARSLGGSGNGEGQFMRPQGVTVDEEGRIIVADSRNNRIQVFEPDGTFLTQWGTFGTKPGELDRPSGICVTPNGRVVVVDFGNNRVQVF
ncbi:E3 ubiquitin-protein ligase TRIM71-like [Ischnura elegans]|uniref:E3 ubiquitin-protein ligase TRIM71-like n=1 Tax=Ischnura elegans TaxID=197161 RepID=UPI001ED89315|nr:E3 ubiquitin-protein ligase TRIM71-like [Ischnura elegans]